MKDGDRQDDTQEEDKNLKKREVGSRPKSSSNLTSECGLLYAIIALTHAIAIGYIKCMVCTYIIIELISLLSRDTTVCRNVPLRLHASAHVQTKSASLCDSSSTTMVIYLEWKAQNSV